MKPIRSQLGVTLVVALIMLVMLTLIGIATFRISTSHFGVIRNMQYQGECMGAAQSAIMSVLSDGQFFTGRPDLSPLSKTVDINGDGSADYAVVLTRLCLLSTTPILVSELSQANADDLKCLGSAAGKNTGLIGQSLGGGVPSECNRATWRVTATITDNFTRATCQVTEGAAVRMDRALAEGYKSNAAFRCAL
jgi:Tfp pilus assembly protein PilX